MNVEDIFSMFNDIFGGMGGSQGGERSVSRGGVSRGYDLETEVEMTLEEVLEGATREVDFKRLDVCETCTGTGGKPGVDPSRCPTCEGNGQVQQAGFGGMFRMVTVCPNCHGRGKIVIEKCTDCRGAGRVSLPRTLEVQIPKGIRDGQVIQSAGRRRASGSRKESQTARESRVIFTWSFESTNTNDSNGTAMRSSGSSRSHSHKLRSDARSRSRLSRMMSPWYFLREPSMVPCFVWPMRDFPIFGAVDEANSW